MVNMLGACRKSRRALHRVGAGVETGQGQGPEEESGQRISRALMHPLPLSPPRQPQAKVDRLL